MERSHASRILGLHPRPCYPSPTAVANWVDASHNPSLHGVLLCATSRTLWGGSPRGARRCPLRSAAPATAEMTSCGLYPYAWGGAPPKFTGVDALCEQPGDVDIRVESVDSDPRSPLPASRLRRVVGVGLGRATVLGGARLVLVDQTARPPWRRQRARDGASSRSSARAGRERIVLAAVSRPGGSAEYGGRVPDDHGHARRRLVAGIGDRRMPERADRHHRSAITRDFVMARPSQA